MSKVQHCCAAYPVIFRAVALAVFGIAPALAAPALASTYQVIHDFTGGADGGVPGYTLAVDRAGQFIGTANSGGLNGDGVVFKPSDGGYPGGGVTLDAGGNLHGTSVLGGAKSMGVIYELTP